MTMKDFLHELTIEYGTAEFQYNRKNCGIEPETKNSKIIYCMWYGDIWKDYDNINELLTDNFFDGKSISDILPQIEVTF